MLILKPKGSDFYLIQYSWFEVGQDTYDTYDTYDEYVKYSVKDLIKSIDTRTTELSHKYYDTINVNECPVNNTFISIVQHRIEKMLIWDRH